MDKPNFNSPPPGPCPRWAQILYISMGIMAGVFFLFCLIKALRHEAGAVFKALPAAVAVGIGKARLRARKSIHKDLLHAHLREIAVHIPLVSPTELLEDLRMKGFPITSIQHMARELASIGLHSQVRSVPGRKERRWYDLSKLAGND